MEEVKKLLVPAVSTYCPQAYTYTFCTQPLAGRMDGCMDGCNGSSLWFNERFNVLHLSFPEDEGLILTLNLWSYEKLLVKTTRLPTYIWHTTSIPLLASCLLPYIVEENRLAVPPAEWKNIASCTHLL